MRQSGSTPVQLGFCAMTNPPRPASKFSVLKVNPYHPKLIESYCPACGLLMRQRVLKCCASRHGIEPPAPAFSGLDSATVILLIRHCLALFVAPVSVRFIGTIMEPKFRLAGTPQFHFIASCASTAEQSNPLENINASTYAARAATKVHASSSSSSGSLVCKN